MGRSKMESQEKRREPHFDTHHIVLKERKKCYAYRSERSSFVRQ